MRRTKWDGPTVPWSTSNFRTGSPSVSLGTGPSGLWDAGSSLRLIRSVPEPILSGLGGSRNHGERNLSPQTEPDPTTVTSAG